MQVHFKQVYVDAGRCEHLLTRDQQACNAIDLVFFFFFTLRTFSCARSTSARSPLAAASKSWPSNGELILVSPNLAPLSELAHRQNHRLSFQKCKPVESHISEGFPGSSVMSPHSIVPANLSPVVIARRERQLKHYMVSIGKTATMALHLSDLCMRSGCCNTDAIH
jgi:hypothetical protein